MQMKKLIVFDLDGTLAASKSPLEAEMGKLLHELLGVMKVAVISGGSWEQFQTQLLANLIADDSLTNLSLLPTCGTKFYQYTGQWKKLYSEDFTTQDAWHIMSSIQVAVKDAGYPVEQAWGETIENRGSQITYSALGQQAPLEAKDKWDPDLAKRIRIKAILDTLIPEFSVRIGGATSIDVTQQGIDKAYGLRKLREILGISLKEMVYIGDALFPEGNDYPAKEAGVSCIQVSGPGETRLVIEALNALLGDN
jgi:HAD superfamily hydrolase (TIGR01484 family)